MRNRDQIFLLFPDLLGDHQAGRPVPFLRGLFSGWLPGRFVELGCEEGSSSSVGPGSTKGRVTAAVQLIVVFLPGCGMFDMTPSESDDDETAPKKACGGSLPRGRAGGSPSLEGSSARASRPKVPSSSNDWARNHSERKKRPRARPVLRLTIPA